MSIQMILFTLLGLVGPRPDDKPLGAWIDVPSPKKILAPSPTYPRVAAQAKVQAAVVVEVTIGPDGHPLRVKPVRNVPLFQEAVEQAIRGWRYEPTVVDGSPRSVVVHEPFYFTLREDKMAERIAAWAKGQRPDWPGALEVKLWTVASLTRLASTQRKAAVTALQELAADPDERVAVGAKTALAALPAGEP